MADIRIIPSTGLVNVTGSINFTSGGSTMLFMTGSTRNLGIGTVIPNTKLDVRGYITSDVGNNAVEGGFYLGNSGHGIRRPGGSSNDVYLYTSAGSIFIGAAGSTSQHITVLNGGNVGIGVTGPQAPLHVIAANQDNNALIQEWSYTSATIDIYSLMLKQTVTSGVVRYNFSMVNNSIAFDNVLVLDRGNVGIGTTNPSNKLEIVGGVKATSFTGSLLGNASTATSATSATTATTASFASTAPYSGLTGTVPTWNQNTTGTAASATNATNATNINITEKNDNVDYQVLFSTTNGTGNQSIFIDEDNTHLTYNPSTRTLSSATLVGALTGNASTATNVAYSGLTGTIPTWNQNTTGNAASATVLQTARTIGGVSFNGSANINLPGVNTGGNQNTTGNAATATTASFASTAPYSGLIGTVPTWNQNTTGNAASATILQTTRTFTIGSTGKNFNGSANVSWTLGEIGAQAALTNPVTGTGTTNFVTKFTGTSTVGNSSIFDNGNVGIGVITPIAKLHVSGSSGSLAFNVEGSQGQLFSVTDSLSGSLMSVNDISGLPILEVFSDDRVLAGKFGTIGLSVSGSNVGIGAYNPARRLDVYDATAQIVAQFSSSNATSVRIRFSDANTGTENVNIGAVGTRLALFTNNNERFSILSGGNVGVGTTTPSALFEVASSGGTFASIKAGGGDFAYLQLVTPSSGTGYIIKNLATGNSALNKSLYLWNEGGPIQFVPSGVIANAVTIAVGGNVGIGTNAPTAPLDTNGVRIGRDFSIASRATVRLDANGTGLPSDILFGHTAAANETSWTGVYWSLSSRANNSDNKFFVYRGAGNPGGSGEEIILALQPNGNIGIGSISPTNKLQVVGGVTATSFTGSLLGNASTATSATSATTSTSSSFASTAPYSGLTGTVPTWNQNTTGNAATATSASFVRVTYESQPVQGAQYWLTIADTFGTKHTSLLSDSRLSYFTDNGTLFSPVFSGSFIGTITNANSASFAPNFANTNLTFNNNRTHNLDGNNLTFTATEDESIIFNHTSGGTFEIKGSPTIQTTGFIQHSGSGYFTGNIGIGTTAPGSRLTVGTSFATVNGLTIDTEGISDSAFVARKAVSKPAFGVLPWDNQVFLTSGVYYDGGVWVHHSSTNDNQLFVLEPSTGVRFYASDNGTGSWNVSSNILLWDNSSIWKSLIRSTRTGDSYFTGGNVGIGVTSPTNLLHLAGASATPSLRLGSITTGFHYDIGRENQTTGDFMINATVSGTPQGAYLRMLQGTGAATFINGVTATSFTGSLLGNASTATSASFASTAPYSGLTGTVPTWNQNTTGNAASATVLQTARTIGGVSFDGSANINLPGVNTAGNQNTSGNASTATTASFASTVPYSGLTGTVPTWNQNTTGNAGSVTNGVYTTGAQTINGIKTFSELVATNPMVNSAGTSNDNSVMQWRYGTSDAYRLRLKQTVTSGVVRWNFSQTNNNSDFNDVLVLDRGNVGIGVTSPAFKLDVTGQGRFTSTVTATKGLFSDSSGQGAVLEAFNTVATNATTAIIRQTTAGGNGNQDIGLLVDIQGAADSDRIANFRYFDGTTNLSRMAITRGGNVGIGITNPSAKFYVNNSGGTGNPFYVDLGNPGGATTLFEHTGASTPVPFRVRKSGYSGASPNYGLLYLHMNDSTIGNGSNLYFTLNDSAGNEHEYAGLGGTIRSNTNGAETGDLFFMTSDAGATRSEKMRIISNGNVGIGTSAPDALLEIVGPGSTFASINAKGGSNAYLQLVTPSSGIGYLIKNLATANSTLDKSLYLWNSDGPIQFVPSGVIGNAVTVAVGGNVGIGTNSPKANLVVGTESSSTSGTGFAGDNSIVSRFGASHAGLRMVGLTIANTGAATISNDATLSFIVAGNYSATGLISSILRNTSTAATDMAFSVYENSMQERMRILSTGNVGIGTTNPSRRLEVLEGNVQIVANFQNTSTASSRIKFTDANTGAENVNIGAVGTRLALFSNNLERLSIPSGGNVGIGVTNPAAKLHVNGTLRVDNAGSAPTPNDGNEITQYYGTKEGIYLADPPAWLAINVGGTAYVIPLY